MGRLARTGLEYYPVDTSWETSMRLVKAKFGLRGIGFMVELYASIYHEGYFRKWDEETELLFSDEMREELEFVHQMIEYALEKSLLDRDIFDRFGVLTSHGIQKRYFKIVSDLGRSSIAAEDGITYPEFVEKYNLPRKADKLPGKADNQTGNADNSPGKCMNSILRKGKEENSNIPAVAENPAPDGAVAKPEPTSHKKSKKHKAELSQDEKDLRSAIRDTFDSRNISVDGLPRYPNHALEGKKVAELATAIRNLAPDNPMLHAQTVLETYLRLTQAPKGTLSGKPFTASTLATNWILQEVIAEIRRTGDASVSVDDMVGEIESKRREREKTEAIA